LAANSGGDTAEAGDDKNDDDKEESSCTVCLEGYNVGEEVSMLSCFHEFHTQCVQSWWVSKAKEAAEHNGPHVCV
jgi:hypothetical protein